MGIWLHGSVVGTLVVWLTLPPAAMAQPTGGESQPAAPQAVADVEADRRTQPGERPWPCRISASREVDRILWQLWNHSATFRRQCDAIGSARVTVIVEVRSPRALSPFRGHTRFFGARGQLQLARVMVTPLESLTWLAHELEHIVERVEGIDYVAQADQGGGRVGVRRTGSSQYETVRAAAAGREAQIEVEHGLAARPPALVVRK